MLTLTLSYNNEFDMQTLEPIWKGLVCGVSYERLIDDYDWYKVDCAILEMAIFDGWEIEKAMRSDEIEETLDFALNTNGSIECIRDQLVKQAAAYLFSHNIIRQTIYA